MVSAVLRHLLQASKVKQLMLFIIPGLIRSAVVARLKIEWNKCNNTRLLRRRYHMNIAITYRATSNI